MENENNERTIKKFSDGTELIYNKGKFDAWKVTEIFPDGKRKSPRDVEYFTYLKDLDDKYGNGKVNEDFIEIYCMTQKEIEKDVLDKIETISYTYREEDRNDVNIVYTILYAAMVAEERKAYTKLGKRIKRLGMYILLEEKQSPAFAANFMKGMSWREIDNMCKQYGF